MTEGVNGLTELVYKHPTTYLPREEQLLTGWVTDVIKNLVFYSIVLAIVVGMGGRQTYTAVLSLPLQFL